MMIWGKLKTAAFVVVVLSAGIALTYRGWAEEKVPAQQSPSGTPATVPPQEPGSTKSGSLALDLSLGGRHTKPGVFEPGEPIRFWMKVSNNGKEAVTLNQRLVTGDLKILVKTAAGKDVAHDPIEAAHQDAMKMFSYAGKVLVAAPSEQDFRQIDPGKVFLHPAFLGFGRTQRDLFMNRRLDRLPQSLLKKPGQYEVRAVWRSTDRRGWTGTLTSPVAKIEILSAERMVELEKGLKLTREQAAAKALAAARHHFRDQPVRLARLKVSEALRFMIRGANRFWHMEYCGDNGLVGRWVVIVVDGRTGKVEVKPSGKVGA